jgi:hypothetical protein
MADRREARGGGDEPLEKKRERQRAYNRAGEKNRKRGNLAGGSGGKNLCMAWKNRGRQGRDFLY